MKIIPDPLSEMSAARARKEMKIFLCIGYPLITLTILLSIYFAIPSFIASTRPFALTFNKNIRHSSEYRYFRVLSRILFILSVLMVLVYFTAKYRAES